MIRFRNLTLALVVLCIAYLGWVWHRKAGQPQPDPIANSRPSRSLSAAPTLEQSKKELSESLMDESWIAAEKLWQEQKNASQRADYLATWCTAAASMKHPKAKERCLMSFYFDAEHMDEHDCFYGWKQAQSTIAISNVDPELAMDLLTKMRGVVHCKEGEKEKYTQGWAPPAAIR